MFLNYTLTYRLLIRNAFAPVAALHIILFIIIASILNKAAKINPIESLLRTTRTMLLNYLNLSLRLMMRNAFLTFINVAGLSIGFTAFYILWPYAQHELKSDRFHNEYEQIAKLSRIFKLEENGVVQSYTLAGHNSGIARQFVREYPEIIELTGVVTQQFFETDRQGFDKDVFVSVANDYAIS